MQNIGDFFQSFLSIGSTVVLPIFIFFFALIMGTKPGKAFRSALLMGISLTGINIMVGYLGSNLGPAMQAMVEHSNLQLDIMDVGWGAVAGAVWGTPIGAIGIPILLIFNIILLSIKGTKTLMIDMWNYHHLVTIGALVYFGTGNFYLGIAATLVGAIITWRLADWSAPILQKFYGIDGISLPTLSSISSLVIAAPMNELLDRIPKIKDIRGNFSSIKKYLGVFGEPASIAVIIGIIIGILARYNVKETLNLAINLAAVMVILPRIVSILMEGLTPISQAAQEKLQQKYSDRDIYLGLDSAISIGHPSVITAALILTPVTILLAAILPWNRVLPFADLTSITFRVSFIVALVGGNVFRTIVIGVIVMAAILTCGTITSPFLTEIFLTTGQTLPEGASGIASFSGGSLFVTYSIVQTFLRHLPSILVCGAVFAAFILVRKSQQRKALEIKGEYIAD
mgnify:FL=1